jgi:hypothetical protein
MLKFNGSEEMKKFNPRTQPELKSNIWRAQRAALLRYKDFESQDGGWAISHLINASKSTLPCWTLADGFGTRNTEYGPLSGNACAHHHSKYNSLQYPQRIFKWTLRSF